MANLRPIWSMLQTIELMQTQMRLLEGLSHGEQATLEARLLDKDQAKQAMAKWVK